MGEEVGGYGMMRERWGGGMGEIRWARLAAAGGLEPP